MQLNDTRRKYRQALDIANSSMQKLNSIDEIYAPIYGILDRENLLVLESQDEFDRAKKLIKDELQRTSNSINPIIGIPALLECIEISYSNIAGEFDTNDWVGPAAKIAIAFIWENIEKPSIYDSSITSLENTLILSLCYSQIRQLCSFSEAFPIGKVRITKRELEFSSIKSHELIQAWNHENEKRGNVLKTLALTKELIWDSDSFPEQLIEVLKGNNPNTIHSLNGSFLQDIPSDSPFWKSIYSRLIAVKYCQMHTEEFNKSGASISLIENNKITISNDAQNGGICEIYLSSETPPLLWEKRWHSDSLDSNLENMISERPIIPIDVNILATSTKLLLESINYLIEDVLLTNDLKVIKKSHKDLFKKYVSEPFEEQCNAMLNNCGFDSGTVNDSGYSKKLNRNISANETSIPGEIDVFCLDHKNKIAFVGECKFLNAPSSKSKLRNLISKLGSADDQCFHAKLEKKIEWIETHSIYCDYVAVGAIIVDKWEFLGSEGKNPVWNINSLKEKLQELIDYVIQMRNSH